MEFFVSHLHISYDQAKSIIQDIRSRYKYDVDAMDQEFPFDKKEFMDFICDVDVSIIPQNKQLNDLLKSMPERKYILTDSTRGHVYDVLSALKISPDLFEAIFDAHDMNYTFKYRPESFALFLKKYDLQACDCIFFEDSICNLQVAKSLDFTTVLIGDKAEDVDYNFPNIVSALRYFKNNHKK